MLIMTAEQMPGKAYQVIGLVQGSTIQCKNVGRDITQSLRSLVGGELVAYTEMMDKAREIALQRMAAAAEQKGADAVICMRLSTSAIAQGAAEVVAYGTAVRWMDECDLPESGRNAAFPGAAAGLAGSGRRKSGAGEKDERRL